VTAPSLSEHPGPGVTCTCPLCLPMKYQLGRMVVTTPSLTDRLLRRADDFDAWSPCKCWPRGPGKVADDLREAALELARLESQLEAVRLAKPAPAGFGDSR
jgi:hypothetical protein